MYNNYLTYTENKWQELSELARQQTLLYGFYNKNYRLVYETKGFLFRFPKNDEKQFDPRPFYEVDVYEAIKPYGFPTPALYHAAPDRSFQVHEYVEGALVDEIYPPGQNLPEDHIDQMTAFYARLANADIDISKIIAPEWPQKGPPLTFFEKLLEHAWIIYRNHQETHKDIYDFLKIPSDPFSHFLIRAGSLSRRPWRLIHANIHRGNMIEKENGQIIIIDWELALYGDLLYCIAAYLHRSRFDADEKEKIAKKIYKALPESFQNNFMKDLSFYLDYEALNSVITDTVRIPDIYKKGDVSEEILIELSGYYADNLNRISPLLETRTTTPEEALSWLKEWAS